MKNILRRLQARVCRAASTRCAESCGPLICAGMVRNEIDIVDIWVSHLNSIFDRIVIYDHLSTDGTRERLHELATIFPNIEVRHFDNPSHEQSALMTATFQEVAATTKSGWMFFLDSDEFLIAKDRSEIERKLSAYRAATSICMVWANAYPVEQTSSLQSNTEINGWIKCPKQTKKIAVNLRDGKFISKVGQGNHGVVIPKGFFFQKIYLPDFRILHLPIRTKAQVISKVAGGVAANTLTLGGEKYARHWKALAAAKASFDIQVQAYNYGNISKRSNAIRTTQPPAPTIVGTLAEYVSLS